LNQSSKKFLGRRCPCDPSTQNDAGRTPASSLLGGYNISVTFASSSASLSTSAAHWCAGSSSTWIDDSRELLHLSLAAINLHKARVHRASGFLLTAFSNATPHTFFSALSTHPGVASEKALASPARNPQPDAAIPPSLNRLEFSL
jgi:hypothetical protein